MDSALRPREIQARIRSGQSLEEVARAAGVPGERIEAFAAPVLAERYHVAGQALAATVRRRGETSAHRNLRPVVAQRLTTAGIDPDEVEWDAWRDQDRSWSVRARYSLQGEEREGLFRYDQRGRFSVAVNDAARWLITEATQEQSDSDELALVRAVSPEAEDGEEPDDFGEADDVGEADEVTQPVAAGPEGSAEPDDTGASDDEFPTSAATPQEIASEVEAEIDSYGVVPEGRSELDVLYDMLGGIAEDSINIYAGLSEPVLDQGAEPEEVEAVEVEVEVETAETIRPEAEPVAAEAPEVVEEAEEADDNEPTHVRIPRPAAAADPATRPRKRSPRSKRPAVVEPEQPSLVDLDSEPAEPAQQLTETAADRPQSPAQQEKSATPAPREEQRKTQNEPPEQAPKEAPEQAPKEAPEQVQDEAPGKPAAKQRKSRKRASVPSWDEIMFGGPPPKQ